MAQRARVHFTFLRIPTSIVIEPVDVITERDMFGRPREYLVGYDDHGLPQKVELCKITHTTVPEPLEKPEPEPVPMQVMRPGWNVYE